MSDFTSAFPNSEKVFVDGAPGKPGVPWVPGVPGVKVPMREIALENGASSLRVYDTSGPQGYDVKGGLPKLREPWVASRRPSTSSGQIPSTSSGHVPSTGSGHALSRGSGRTGHCVTQLYYARKREITPEMEFVAIREGLPADFV